MSAGPVISRLSTEQSRELSDQWRALRRAATGVAVLTSPALFVWLHKIQELSVGWSLVLTILSVAAFRGLLDLIFHRFIRWPSLFGIDNDRLREEDIVARRRVSFWHFWFRLLFLLFVFVFLIYLFKVLTHGADSTTLWGTASDLASGAWNVLSSPTFWSQVAILPLFFVANFLLFFGPMMAMGVSQIRGFEPGDADWGVKLPDVRGQAEAKEEVRRVVNLWQSGEAFEEAGGKRERGLLFLGAPGTGKTMLSKAIATGFNCPFLSMPGSGFAQTFIGMDVIIVRYMARKAKRLARKWGGQCIVFIDEIDAVGRRRQALEGGGGMMTPSAGIDSFEEHCFFGPHGSLTPSGDLFLETRAWRERLFAQRAEQPRINTVFARLSALVNQVGGIGMMGGQQTGALNQLLVVMDGIDNPPFMRKFFTNRLNTLLDALYVIPTRIGSTSLRLPRPQPRGDQIYFIGATNVPLEALDPALVRPGRMGRHVWFRTPTQRDRLDVFDLYIRKVAHDPDLDTPERRDELARITMGYSPAMIEQVCSMALTYAHHEGRPEFNW